jgi:hypothetical protein
VSTMILTKAQLDAKRAKEEFEARVAVSRAKSSRWASRRHTAKARKKAKHRKVRKHLEKQGRRNAR